VKSSQNTQIVVSLALFTAADAISIEELGLVRKLTSVGNDSLLKIGTGLFVVTRSTNMTADLETSENDSLGKLSGVAAEYFRNDKHLLPTTLVRLNETLLSAARRISWQQLGLVGDTEPWLRQVRIFDNPTPGDSRVITVCFWGFVNFEDLVSVLGGRDQVGLELVTSSKFIDEWGGRHGLDQFDGVSRFGNRASPRTGGHERQLSHEITGDTILGVDFDEMVFYAWRRLRYGFGGPMDPFRFLRTRALPEKFRLSDLRELHDVCRGERSQIDKFRRELTRPDSYLSPLTERDSTKPGKPAVLFSLAPWADPDIDQPSDGAKK